MGGVTPAAKPGVSIPLIAVSIGLCLSLVCNVGLGFQTQALHGEIEMVESELESLKLELERRVNTINRLRSAVTALTSENEWLKRYR